MNISKTDARNIIRLLRLSAQYFKAEARQTYIAGLNGSKLNDKARIMNRLATKLSNQIENGK